MSPPLLSGTQGEASFQNYAPLSARIIPPPEWEVPSLLTMNDPKVTIEPIGENIGINTGMI
jgi:hypothetical protein